MPELPEVETVRAGLEPALVGARIETVELRRADLRFPLPERFAERLVGASVLRLDRRGKYILAPLSTGEALIIHLGMTGRFSISGAGVEPRAHSRKVDPVFGENVRQNRILDHVSRLEFTETWSSAYYETQPPLARHDHVVFHVIKTRRKKTVTYNDARRFGMMDLAPSDALHCSKHLAAMGPEPLSDEFMPKALAEALARRSTPIKTALLDQRVVAGLGNIYVVEALFRAGISPTRPAASLRGREIPRLHAAIIDVLREAITFGGSTLRNFAAADGAPGGFQERFSVYDREDAPCPNCAAPVRRLVQAGRSTFYCAACQK